MGGSSQSGERRRSGRSGRVGARTSYKQKASLVGETGLLVSVELRGFEPLTSSMPWKRATNCAKAPRCLADSGSLADGGPQRKIGWGGGEGEEEHG